MYIWEAERSSMARDLTSHPNRAGERHSALYEIALVAPSLLPVSSYG